MNIKHRYLYLGSSLLLIFGAALGLMESLVFDLLYLLGGLGYMLYFLLAPRGQQLDLRTSRLVKMSLLASLLFILSAVARLGYLRAYGQGLWILFFVLGLVFMIYANFIGLYMSRGKNKGHQSKKQHDKKNK
ncbi:MAG: hypothetical protein Q4A61_03120 [Porphyromonadaceae bacterium]|nr:hypothetical protein [Porphyromonadaceae bacterium]